MYTILTVLASQPRRRPGNRIGCDEFGSIASMTDAAGSGWSRWTITSAGSSGVAPQAKGGEDRATMWPNRRAAVTRRIHNY
jgi:hypothetical protein